LFCSYLAKGKHIHHTNSNTTKYQWEDDALQSAYEQVPKKADPKDCGVLSSSVFRLPEGQSHTQTDTGDGSRYDKRQLMSAVKVAEFGSTCFCLLFIHSIFVGE
jgi:hypothetical protein